MSNAGIQTLVDQVWAFLVALTDGCVERGLIAIVVLAPRCHVEEFVLGVGVLAVLVGVERKLTTLLTKKYLGRGAIVPLAHKEKPDGSAVTVTVAVAFSALFLLSSG